ncbi:GntR family transcriptional regulator [Carnobacterium sp. CS13]|uniref:GntR family transcriptional regulator n=1 Tax=Carnobacterium sp. CS13 TaxID=2800128 RepID=UPI0019120430|nr:GntR family transcriptional regulator [Carnobacterium sp. CS13]QQP69685.1 GntR family transcriptional regulator [Carnobacterium sp. CS13]
MKIPKYQQIKNDLLKKIEVGEFEHGDRFYSEAELVKLYNVSSITVIRAIQELASEGYLVRYQGKGTYVSRSRKRKLVEFSDIEVFAGKTETVEVLSIEEENDANMRKELRLLKNETYYKITRVRKVDGDPFLLHFSYIPSQFIKKDIPNLAYYDSIYNRFKSDFNIRMYDQESKETNEIFFPTEKDLAAILLMKENEPTVRQDKKTILQDGTVAEVVVSYKKWNYYKIELSTFNDQH